MKVIIRIEFPELTKKYKIKPLVLRCKNEQEMKTAFNKLAKVKLDA